MILRITVLGMVQGVGYRPFAARLAEELSISGTVKNSGGIVVILASGRKEALLQFIHRLQFPGMENTYAKLPAGAQVTDVRTAPVPVSRFIEAMEKAGKQNTDLSGFSISDSDRCRDQVLPLIPPDLGVCEECLRELSTWGDRRYRYPLISCVACGPRFSIINTLPYDRDTTVMEDFPMCAACAGEYTGKGRRRHAQTISCHDCGPQIAYRDLQAETAAEDGQTETEAAGSILAAAGNEQALLSAVRTMQSGGIVAVKGIGGYQLVCLPSAVLTVINLRSLKGREGKPFAVLFHDMEQIRENCEISAEEETLLRSSARPIVLLDKKCDRFPKEVSGESRCLGAFLPNTPIQSLLTGELGPLIVTSCNRSSEPIMTTEAEVLEWKPPLLAGMLSHNRRILTPLDDSVASLVMGRMQITRRSRGYVPMPVLTGKTFKTPLLAMGGDLKACFGLAAEGSVYLSQYYGDMESLAVMRAYEEGLLRMERLFGIRPERVVCDLHPGYATVRLAQRMKESGAVMEVVKVQHHHAHIGAVMAEHHLASCIGVAFDGTGYGEDGAVWGGEFLYCRASGMERMGHLAYTLFCGGDEASKDGELALMCYLAELGAAYEAPRYPLVKAALQHRVNVIPSSSMGRLFDAVSALLGIKRYNTYEGECAIALEQAAYEAQKHGKTPYLCQFEINGEKCGDEIITASAPSMIQALRTALAAYPEITAGELALGFHHAAADMVLGMCLRIRETTGESRVALSGGVFANRLLLELCCGRLEAEGFAVYWNETVPCNDGGLALGQAWLCGQ